MTEWSRWSIAFFAYLALAAEFRPGMTRRRQVDVWCASALGAAVAVASQRLAATGPADVLILPAAVLLIGYWASGRLFVRPMPRAECALRDIDRLLRIPSIAARCPHLVVEYLELSYGGVSATIVIALVIALRYGVSADRFWTTILVTDFVCFGTMPWFQTRPPRAVGFDAPWRSRWRWLNEWILGAAGVHVNTFPSGHAAEALAVALLVSAAPAPIVALMWVNALTISAGAVLGRYHYAADVFAGWAVALAVFFYFST